jgi:hypothetical protein
MPTYSTSSGVVREYFECLRWLSGAAREVEDIQHSRRLAAMATIQAVTAVEVFMNLWFRAFVEDRKDEDLHGALLRDLKAKTSLERRLATWPKKYLGTKLDLREGPGGDFVRLKNIRNSIVHFHTTHETVRAPQLIMHGLADTTEYDALNSNSAQSALAIVEEFVAEIFRLAQFDAATSENALAAWIAKPGVSTFANAMSTTVPPWLAPHVER